MAQLMTLAQADEILEDFDNALQAHSECMAEAGMGAVSMGYDGYDGMAEYSAYNPAPQPDDQVREAQEVAATFADLEMVEYGDLSYHMVSSARRIPEFFPFTTSQPSPMFEVVGMMVVDTTEDIPF